MARRWLGQGPGFAVEWGGRTWTLRVDGERPGLWAAEGSFGPLLVLEGLAEPGRWEPRALSGTTLVGFEERLGRVEATYAPPDWGELTVRAAWAPHGEDGIDLEVQISARSVGRLRKLEALVTSGLVAPPRAGVPLLVEPRDARSAALSYDGREPDLASLTTLPPGPAPPLLCRPAGGPPGCYAELVHPQDVTRRITWGEVPARTARSGLFGHDLERGIVLRARLRGLWLPEESPESLVRDRFAQFLGEPPPLMT